MLEPIAAPPRHTQGCTPQLKGQRCSHTLPHDQPVITRPMSKSLAPSVGRTVFPPNVNSWHELAALGCFVYCYLRADGTPYYVGIAKLANRPIKRQKSDTKPPRDHSGIRVLRSGLTWDAAQDWERFYIARYGRKDLGTGILRNRTDGGDGIVGLVPSPISEATRDKMRAVAKQRGIPDWVANLGRQKSRQVNLERAAARHQAAAESMGVSVEEFLRCRAKADAERSSARREARRRALGMTGDGYRQWMLDGKPSNDLSRYQEKKKPGRKEWTKEQRAATAAITTAHYAAKAAQKGLTLEEQKAINRRNKRQRAMEEARSKGMTKRQHAAWVTAGRPSFEAA